MDSFKRKLIPASQCNSNFKAILINDLFGNKDTDVKSMNQSVRRFISKMKSMNQIADAARSIGLNAE